MRSNSKVGPHQINPFMPKNKKLVVNVGRGIANKNYMQEENWKGEGVKNWEICKRNLCMSPYQGIYRFAVVPFL